MKLERHSKIVELIGKYEIETQEELAEHLRRYKKPVTVCGSIEEGVSAASKAAGDEGMVCAVGSLYMAGAVRACFNLF